MNTISITNLKVVPSKTITKQYRNASPSSASKPTRWRNKDNWNNSYFRRRSGGLIDANLFDITLNPDIDDNIKWLLTYVDRWTHLGSSSEAMRIEAAAFIRTAEGIAKSSIRGKVVIMPNLKKLRDQTLEAGKRFKSKKFSNKLWNALFVLDGSRTHASNSIKKH